MRHDRRSSGRGQESAPQADPAVIAFLSGLDHPLKQEIEAVRQIILGADPSIREGIKWNAPSFRTTEYFATFNLRGKGGLRIVLHIGAKAKATAETGIKIPDPAGLLEWLAKDRALVTIADKKDVEEKREALEGIVREWIRWVE
jgi:hypothetical protein